jgi:hypothetical protein
MELVKFPLVALFEAYIQLCFDVSMPSGGVLLIPNKYGVFCNACRRTEVCYEMRYWCIYRCICYAQSLLCLCIVVMELQNPTSLTNGVLHRFTIPAVQTTPHLIITYSASSPYPELPAPSAQAHTSSAISASQTLSLSQGVSDSPE